jgi:ubiquinone/menaquinone biosynthesis C-methylase UbiE
MKRTDYSKIASVYDQHEARLRNPPDEHLAERLRQSTGPFSLLDVACGTGNYLAAQHAAYPDVRIAWHGIDASPDMLQVARGKLDGVEWREGRAEALPYADGAFDYLSCNFAFHHFENKHAALDEMQRVLKPNGGLRIANVAMEYMAGWWVFQFFPEARLEDEKRFWSAELLRHELERRGFEAGVDIRIKLVRRSAKAIYREAAPRDLSSLAIVSQQQFDAGLAQLAALAARDETIADTECVMICSATPPRG